MMNEGLEREAERSTLLSDLILAVAESVMNVYIRRQYTPD